ncbi:MAG: rimI [Thermoleophilia bacterium]|nr:rimI [Thermoleophilia bacterium]
MSWRLRPADGDDLAAIMDLEVDVFPSDAWSRTMMEAELNSEHTVYLVAVTGGALDEPRPDGTREGQRIVGYAGLLAPSRSTDAEIQTIAVTPSERRTGLGRALMNVLLDTAAERGAQAVFLEVREDNPAAQNLYRSLGFEELGVRPHYYQPDDVSAIIMRRATPRQHQGQHSGQHSVQFGETA